MSITASTPTRCLGLKSQDPPTRCHRAVHGRNAAAARAPRLRPSPAAPGWVGSRRSASAPARAPAAPGVAVLLDRPPLLRGQPLRVGLAVDGPDELGRVGHRRIVGIDQRHRQNRRDRLLVGQEVAEFLLDGNRSCPRSARRGRRTGTTTPRRNSMPAATADPTWGPLPCEMTSSWSMATGLKARHATRTFSRWFSTVIGSPRFCSAFPPSATTTRIPTS